MNDERIGSPFLEGYLIATASPLDMSRSGECYSLSAEKITGIGGSGLPDAEIGKDWLLVHGTIEGWGNPPLKHGWVEDPDGDRAWEPFSNKWYPKTAFDAYFHAEPEATYTRAEAVTNLVSYRHYGPWDDDNPPLPDYDDDEFWGDDEEEDW